MLVLSVSAGLWLRWCSWFFENRIVVEPKHG